MPPEPGTRPPLLPARAYVDPERHRREAERVFRRSWLPVARASELARPGAYATLVVDGSPIAVVRGADGGLAAFHDACRHRGARILREERGCARELVCPYHAVAYDLGGTLARLPRVGRFPEGFEPGRVRLPEIAAGELAGWVFVNLDPAAGPLAEDLGPMAGELDRWPLAALDVKARRAYEVDFDWKVGVEAFVEPLHVPHVHGRSLHPFVDVARTEIRTFGEHSGMHVPFRMPNAHAPEGVLGAAAHAAGVETFPGLDEEQLAHHYAYLVFPSTILLVSPNDAMLLSMLPLGAGRTHVRVEVLGSPSTTEAQAAYYASLEPAYDRLLSEDLVNLPHVQRGLASGSLERIAIGPLEPRIAHFHACLEARLA